MSNPALPSLFIPHPHFPVCLLLVTTPRRCALWRPVWYGPFSAILRAPGLLKPRVLRCRKGQRKAFRLQVGTPHPYPLPFHNKRLSFLLPSVEGWASHLNILTQMERTCSQPIGQMRGFVSRVHKELIW